MVLYTRANCIGSQKGGVIHQGGYTPGGLYTRHYSILRLRDYSVNIIFFRHEELLALDGVYSKMWQAQLQKAENQDSGRASPASGSKSGNGSLESSGKTGTGPDNTD